MNAARVRVATLDLDGLSARAAPALHVLNPNQRATWQASLLLCPIRDATTMLLGQRLKGERRFDVLRAELELPASDGRWLALNILRTRIARVRLDNSRTQFTAPLFFD
jgi:hypothetical protein